MRRVPAALAVAICALIGTPAFADTWAAGAASDLASCPTVTRTTWTQSWVDQGAVTVTNDATDLIVTITGHAGWMVDEWRIYADANGWVPVDHGRATPASGEVVLAIPLAEFDAACGTTPRLAVQTVMVKEARGWIARLFGWAGQTMWLPAFWGGPFAYPVCCLETCNEPALPPPSSGACRRATYTWAAMPLADWPAALSCVNLGSTAYTVEEVDELLDLPFRQPETAPVEVSIFLAQQVAAALLNAHAGVALPDPVLEALADADAWFDANAPADSDGDGKVPFGLLLGDDPVTLEASRINHLLDAFNKGSPACSP